MEKGIEAWMGNTPIQILGFVGMGRYVFGNEMKEDVLVVYYDLEDSSGKLKLCTLDMVSIKV